MNPLAEVSLRPATEDDYGFLWLLHCATMRDYVAPIWGWAEAWQRPTFHEHFLPERIEVVEIDGQPVGRLSVERSEERLFLTVIQITPGYQNRGIGAKLIRELLVEADRRQVPVELQVLRSNPAAQRLYERLGFTILGETKTHYLLRRPPLVKHGTNCMR